MSLKINSLFLYLLNLIVQFSVCISHEGKFSCSFRVEELTIDRSLKEMLYGLLHIISLNKDNIQHKALVFHFQSFLS